MDTILGAEVSDAAGEALGKVVKETPDWVLVEKTGVVNESRVVMRDEIATVEPVRVRLRVTQSSMETRADRPGVSRATENTAGPVA
jgi:hypothetical protein